MHAHQINWKPILSSSNHRNSIEWKETSQKENNNKLTKKLHELWQIAILDYIRG